MDNLSVSDNCILAYNGSEVYQNEIDILCDEYINTLPIPDLIYSKASVFNGLLDYIYRKRLKKIIDSNSNGYNNNYNLLDCIFRNIFKPLCHRFNKTITVINFCCFVNIDYSIVRDIRDGVYHSNGQKVKFESTAIIKKWFLECENSLVSKASEENTIGSLFLLKSVFSYSENNQITVINQLESKEDPAMIAEKYKTVSIPEKPDI